MNKTTSFLGADPGLNGGLAIVAIVDKCSLLAFASFPAAWQEPEIMGINIESDSKGR